MNSILLISGAVRAAVVLAVGLVAYALVSRAAAATRRLVLVLTLGAAIVVPVAAAVGPRWTWQAPAGLSIFAHESANEGAPGAEKAGEPANAARRANPRAAESSSAGRLDANGALVFAWVLVAAALLARTAVSHLRARAIAHRAAPVESAPWIEAARHAAGG